jgi:6-phosphogluconolactonase (cycloisomerase 2 family)
MVNRRDFLSLLAGSIATPRITWAETPSGMAVLYASVGPELTQYDVDADSVALTRRGSVILPAGVQYAWPHVSGQYLYVASSNGGVGLGAAAGDNHHASVFRIDPLSGALAKHGDPIVLPSRPIHITTDIPSRHVLIAYNNPSRITVHRVNGDGTLGSEIKQPAPIDAGIYAHQTRIVPSNGSAILVTRGNDPNGGRPEDPGALKIFDFKDGLLTNEVSIAPGGGYGFGPRHLDFHPTQPWIYASLERQNQIWVYKLNGNGVNPEPLFEKATLTDPNVRPRQLAGTVHVHPNGRFVYGVNRADGTMDSDGRRVFVGGENTIVVYAIDPNTGEPTLIQSADTRGIHARTFHIDPSGRMLVAANIMPLLVRDDATVRMVPASLSAFRIGGDGKLEFVRKYDVDVRNASMFWMGMVRLPQHDKRVSALVPDSLVSLQ